MEKEEEEVVEFADKCTVVQYNTNIPRPIISSPSLEGAAELTSTPYLFFKPFFGILNSGETEDNGASDIHSSKIHEKSCLRLWTTLDVGSSK